MKKPDPASLRPVSRIVSSILEDARKSWTDGPSSALYGHRAQLSATLTQAGTLLAALDRADPPRKSSMLQSVLASLGGSRPATRRRSWFFASAEPGAMPDARRIEQLLKSALKDGKRLVLDVKGPVTSGPGDDLHCVLPEGASDPVCEPRS